MTDTAHTHTAPEAEVHEGPARVESPVHLTWHQYVVVAARAGVDPRTARSILSGNPSWSTTSSRVWSAARELGFVGG